MIGPQRNKIYERLKKCSSAMAKKYDNLTWRARYLADYGLTRHFQASDRYGTKVIESAVREILDDAAVGRSIANENAREPLGCDERYISTSQRCIDSA